MDPNHRLTRPGTQRRKKSLKAGSPPVAEPGAERPRSIVAGAHREAGTEGGGKSSFPDRYPPLAVEPERERQGRIAVNGRIRFSGGARLRSDSTLRPAKARAAWQSPPPVTIGLPPVHENGWIAQKGLPGARSHTTRQGRAFGRDPRGTLVALQRLGG
jgi:hypothetical protein